MCMGGTPAAPPPPAALPQAPQTPAPPTGGTPEDADIRRRRAAAGESGTILTGPRGIEGAGAATGAKTLLGR
jgi:hypothetical protein